MTSCQTTLYWINTHPEYSVSEVGKHSVLLKSDFRAMKMVLMLKPIQSDAVLISYLKQKATIKQWTLMKVIWEWLLAWRFLFRAYLSLKWRKNTFFKKIPHSKVGVRKDWYSISRQGKQSCSRCWNRKRSSVIFCFLIALIPCYSTWLSCELRAATGLKILAAFLSHTGHMFTQCSCGFPLTVQTYRSHESDTLYF